MTSTAGRPFLSAPSVACGAGSGAAGGLGVSGGDTEVLRLMAEGLPSREIATKLGISYATVRTHIRSLGAKLGVHSKVQAIVKARELALID